VPTLLHTLAVQSAGWVHGRPFADLPQVFAELQKPVLQSVSTPQAWPSFFAPQVPLEVQTPSAQAWPLVQRTGSGPQVLLALQRPVEQSRFSTQAFPSGAAPQTFFELQTPDRQSPSFAQAVPAGRKPQTPDGLQTPLWQSLLVAQGPPFGTVAVGAGAPPRLQVATS
jgi:hypothetical protein